MQWHTLVEQCPLRTADEKFTMIRATLKGRALDVFTTTYPTDLEDMTDDEKQYGLEAAFVAVSKGVFNDDTSAWRRQRNCMRYHLHFQVGQLHEFKNRLYEMNKYLQYFPIPAGRDEVTSLEDDELLEIIDRAKPMEYQQALSFLWCCSATKKESHVRLVTKM